MHGVQWPARLGAAMVTAAVLAIAGGAAAQAQQNGNEGTPVRVTPIQEVNEAPRLTFSGLLEPAETALVSPDESGKVTEILAREGAQVEQGQVLARLDNPGLRLEKKVLEAQVAELEAQRERSRQALQRVEELYKKRLAPEDRYDDEQAAYRVSVARLESGRARLNQINERLELLAISAPLNGEVIRADLKLGQWISPGQAQYEIYSFETFEVMLGVPGKYMADVPHQGQVPVRVPELETQLQGRIAAVIQHVEGESGNFTVRVRVPNEQGLPLSGLLAEAAVPVGEPQSVLAVPRDALVQRGGLTQVVVVRDRRAEILSVRVRGTVSQGVIVEGEGLQAGEPVVVRGNERLRPGASVRVVQEG